MEKVISYLPLSNKHVLVVALVTYIWELIPNKYFNAQTILST